MRLLIIGQLSAPLTQAAAIAKKRGASVSQADSIDQALAQLSAGKGADLLMVDVGFDIASLITQLNAQHICVPVIGCGITNDSASAVKAIKAGAKEYVPLPPDEEMIAAVLEAITQQSHKVIGSAPAMQKLFAMVDRVAPSQANVLITGESGTGKEVISQLIHRSSPRKSNQMISVNCAAIPDNLLESELFGHEKGAFTGALSKRIGKFEEADQSTLLLDEISEMDLRLQAKLLRAIQEKEIDRVGGNKPIAVDIRIIATSNRNLQKEVEEGRFRQDLYYRLNVIHLNIPSLHERKQDIPAFSEHFVEKYAEVNGVENKPLTKEAMQKLVGYHWPGNVREFENTMHRAVLMAMGDHIEADDILLMSDHHDNSHSADAASSFEVGQTVADVEKTHILNTLDHCLGNRTQAASILGISIRTLRNKLQEYEKQAS